MDPVAVIGSIMGIGFVSGLNLYATVLTLGLGVRFGLLSPHAGLPDLTLLGHPYVLIAAGVLYAVEFFADKVPWVDSLWDTFHMVIRPLGAAGLAAGVVGTTDPVTKTIIILLCGGVAFSGHATKAGTRLLANTSPEPVSNITLSVVEDVLAVGGAWLAVTHPVLMLAAVLIFLAVFCWVSPKIFRLVRAEIMAVLYLLKRLFAFRPSYVVAAGVGAAFPSPGTPGGEDQRRPLGHTRQPAFAIKCVAGKGLRGVRNSIGRLEFKDEGIFFLTRRWFRPRAVRVDWGKIEEPEFSPGLLFDRLTWSAGKKRQTIYFFKYPPGGGREAADLLQSRQAGRGIQKL